MRRKNVFDEPENDNSAKPLKTDVKSMKFTSKKDWWLTIIVWGPMLFSIGGSWYKFFTEEFSMGNFVFLLLPSVSLPIFVLWLWLTTYYVLNENNLVIRSGPIKIIIPINSIKSVKKTINPLASPALSLKRLEIAYGPYNDIVLISPKDRDEFMKILRKRCPQAEIKI